MAGTAVLGIDLGTTTVKVAVVSADSCEVLGTWSCETRAAVCSDAGPLASEQDVYKILSAVDTCMSAIPPDLKARVIGIGVCGQMHGLVLWKKASSQITEALTGPSATEQFSRLSHLYTWQDGRCSADFLASLPSPNSHLRVATGFGCATVLWLTRHELGSLEVYDSAGTVQDILVTALCDLDKPVMSSQNAASWGYFNTMSNSWNTEILSGANFPVKLLPDVVSAGEKAGTLAYQWHGISKGVPVTAAMGDLQCYILSKVQDDYSAVINIGTSAQFTFVMPQDFSPTPSTVDHTSPVEYVPYFAARYLSETASLNGGNALASFVTTLCHWLKELDYTVDESVIWDRVGQFVGEEELCDSRSTDAELSIDPMIFGERHVPESRYVTARNALPSNASLRNVCRALSWGVVANLRSMSPGDLPKELVRVIGSGGALARNAVMRHAVTVLFGLPLHVDLSCGNADSAVGAAIAGVRYLLKPTE